MQEQSKIKQVRCRVIGDGYIDDDIGGDTVGNANIDGDISDRESEEQG